MRWASYRVRAPLSLAAVITVTAAVLSLAVAYQTYVNIGIEQQRHAKRLAYAMEPVLARAMKHDDVWLAFSLLHGPARRDLGPDAPEGSTLVLVDGDGQIFAANRPRAYPISRSLADIDAVLAQAVASADDHQRPGWPGPGVLALPVHSDDAVVGTLAIRLPEGAFWVRFREILAGGAWAIGLTLALFIPLGWIWGRRMVAPLATLTRCMARIGKSDISQLDCPVLGGGDDEIGQLGRQFQLLINDLKGKRALEQQLISQERLAAIGRVAAGVAHEINNPLGGLLTAIDTYRHRPPEQRHVERTLDLVERGLNQIHETVSALLVESRIEMRPLVPHDLDDVETLLRTDPAVNQKTINWQAEVVGELPVPASAVRQILLNLCLNAVQSAPPGGHVEVSVYDDGTALGLRVSNDGRPIPAQLLPHLFEPFFTDRVGGTGLGLWITYQMVTQLGGRIRVHSDAQNTLFAVTLPFAPGLMETSE